MRRRMVARTAVVGGAAYVAAKHGAAAGQREAEEAAAAQAPPAQPQAPQAEAQDPIEQLKQLNELRQQGILTEEEFTAEKKKLLGQ
jgi:hypothetical protein